MEATSWYTYTPGIGNFGYLPGYNKVPVHWGKEVEAQRKEWEAQHVPDPNRPPLDRTSNFPAPFEPLEAPFERRTLTKDELNELATELAAKYDPTNMTDEEYDSLLFELVDQGILCENELGLMGLHGQYTLGYGWTIGSFSVSMETLYNNPYYQQYGNARSIYDAKGNALAYASLVALYKSDGGDGTFSSYAEAKLSSHKALAEVLEAVQRKRQALGLDGENDNTSNAYADRILNSGLTWAEAMTRWKTASSPSDSLDVEDVRNDMYAALDNVLKSIQRKRLRMS